MMLMVRIPFDQFDRLVNDAVKYGYLRENPRKAWTYSERRAAVRWYLQQLAVRGGER